MLNKHPKLKAFLQRLVTPDEDDLEGIRGSHDRGPDFGQLVYNALTRWILTAILLAFSVPVVMVALTPPGIPGVVASILARACQSSGQCNINVLLPAFAVSLIICCYISIALLFAVYDPIQAKLERNQQIDETHSNLLLIDDQIDALQEQVRMIQWHLIVKPRLDKNPNAVISLKSGEVLGFMNQDDYNDDPEHGEEYLSGLAEGEVMPWKQPEVVKEFGENLNQIGE